VPGLIRQDVVIFMPPESTISGVCPHSTAHKPHPKTRESIFRIPLFFLQKYV
jgi:hypothetical protein